MKNKVKTKKTKNGALTVLVYGETVWVVPTKNLDQFIKTHSLVSPKAYDAWYSTDEAVEIRPKTETNVFGLKLKPSEKEMDEDGGAFDLEDLSRNDNE